jgi:capsular exopolysaccharide synthesis family protein
VLAGRLKLSHAIRSTAVPGLRILPAGSPTGNPAELLSSPRFAKLLEALGNHRELFQWVIIDSPPVAAVSDSCLVAKRSAAVLFVVGSQLTSRKAALHALEQLDAADATFVGAVLNRVQLRRDAYYYSQYYRPAYEKYYMDVADAPTSEASVDEFDVADAVRDSARPDDRAQAL